MTRPLAIINIAGLSPSLFGDATPRLRSFARRCGGIRTIIPPLPAVTCSAQATILTGTTPSEHGIVGNGWFDRGSGEVHFWKQSNGLVSGEKLWDAAKTRDPTVTAANCFWWFNMHSTADIEVTPRPCYTADGRKIPDIATKPFTLRARLQSDLGAFPLFKFWGPSAGIECTDWIALASMEVWRLHKPTIQLVYLPHLDYCLQKFGPGHRSIQSELREVDRVFGALLDFYDRVGVRVAVVSEYGIAPVTGAVLLNRTLREAGLLALRDELGHDMIDVGACEAFAVCDHQVAHVRVRQPGKIAEVKRLLESVAGVDQVLDRTEQAAVGLAHERAGELVAVSKPDKWFAYPFWMDDHRAPDFARTVDIHRKPGYDPCELFFDPRLMFPRLRVARKLLLRRLGMRTLLDVIPLDPTLVRGSHGRVHSGAGLDPVYIADDPRADGESVPAHQVKAALLAQMFDC
ncbi:MAG: alkaline phosphatase family protein [Phycisphaerales bacterium]|nr:alkaline phosphatase family protein [Phycisphaerales bacterium]